MADEAEIRDLIADFLSAFQDLDWPRFRACWNEEPVAFYPSLVPEPSGRRVDSPAEFEAAWKRQFDRIRESAKSGPPFHLVEPRDLRVDMVSSDVAVVTFHLGPDDGVLGRRLLVLGHGPNGWKITHLHASNLSGLF